MLSAPLTALALVLAAPASAGDCWPREELPFVESIGTAVGDAFRVSLHDELRRSHTYVVPWSEARKFMYGYYDDGTGMVWDVYGQTRLRGPALGMEEKLVNVEHTWPQSYFGGWGQRKPQKKIAKAIQGDLHNLFPASEKLNSDRGNLPFAELPGCDDPTASCGTSAAFEPADAQKGDTARAMFYMAVRYGYSVPDDMERTLRRWDLADPPDDAERARNGAIAAVQGNRNPFIDDAGLAGRIRDF